jgi:hypothetical protein
VAKKAGVSAFDEILGSFGSDEDREAFSGLAERNPRIKEYGLRESDYTRFMNENGEKIKELEGWQTWRAQNWDEDRKMTKAEAAKETRLQELQEEKERLERQVAFGGLGGEDMNFAQLEGDLGNWAKEKGFVTQDVVKAKEEEFRGVNQWVLTASVHVPYLNQKHKDEFGELFDPDEFLKEATAKQRFDLRLQGMGPSGMGPTDDGGPQMGAFQKQYLKLDKPEGGSSAAPEVPIGEGGIAAFAARKFREDALAGKS